MSEEQFKALGNWIAAYIQFYHDRRSTEVECNRAILKGAENHARQLLVAGDSHDQ